MQPQGSEQQTTSTQDTQQSEGEQQEVASPSLQQQLETERRQRDEYLDLLRRTQADFINYKRRVAQEQSERRTVAQGAMLETLLPVLDDLGRAIEAAPPEWSGDPWEQGILLVEKRLASTLDQIGLHRIGVPGEAFDPHLHEALMTQPRADIREGTIVQVIRPGYAYDERVLRPAQVIVASEL